MSHFSLHPFFSSCSACALSPQCSGRWAQGVNWVKVISRARLGRSSWVRPSMIPNRHLTERTHITGANQPAAKISLLHRFCLGLPTHILPSSQPFVSLKVQKSYNNCGNLNHNQDIFKVAQILQRSGWHSLGIRLKFGFKLQAVIMWTNNCKKSLFDPF